MLLIPIRKGDAMDLAYIKKVIKLIEKSEVDEIEIEEEGKKIRVAKSKPVSVPASVPLPPQVAIRDPLPLPVQQPVLARAESVPEIPPVLAPEQQYHEVRSPIVGTFYRAPSPDAEPYVQVGQRIRSGDVLCIIEAMKLMNEIESDVEGTIAKILVENAKPVEYNQLLFLIEK